MARVLDTLSKCVLGCALIMAVFSYTATDASSAQTPANGARSAKGKVAAPASQAAAPASSLFVAGNWTDSYSYTWILHQKGTALTGVVDVDCNASTPWPVAGAVTSDTLFYLKATNPGGPDTCSDWFQYNMTSTSATAASGTWTRSDGATGSVSMTLVIPPKPDNFKQALAEIKPDAVLHFTYVWESSTDDLDDLKRCEISEKVSYPGTTDFKWPSPPYDPAYPPTPNPTFITVPATDGIVEDFHLHAGFVGPYAANKFVSKQNYRYRCKTQKTQEFSGFTDIPITRHVKDRTDRGCWIYIIDKSSLLAHERLPGVSAGDCARASPVGPSPAPEFSNSSSEVGISASLPKASVGLNEPVFVDLSVVNHRAGKVMFDLGLNKKANIEVAVWGPGGGVEIRSLPSAGFGASGEMSLGPGGSFKQRLLLNEWYRFMQPGSYRVKMTLLGAAAENLRPSAEFSLQIGPRDPARIDRIAARLADRAITAMSLSENMDAANALSYIVDPAAVSSLRRVLEQGSLVEHYAVDGLARIGNSEAIAALKAERDHPDEDVRDAVNSALALVRTRFSGVAQPAD